MSLKAIFACIAAILVFTTANADGDAKAGEAKSTICAACHGIDGNSNTNPLWPKLAGQHSKYLSNQLQLYKSGARIDPIMQAQVINLSVDDMNDIASYFASKVMTSGVADDNSVDIGEKLWRGGNADSGIPACMACHGPTGKGNPLAPYPVVAGQHSAYTAKSLNDYAANTRANQTESAKIMVDIAQRMSPTEINHVASYIEGLHSAN